MNPIAKEQERLREAKEHHVPWRKWGPYLSERQWGTVREDMSENGDAWNALTHDQSRSYAYRSGEDGIAGFCDEHMRLCFAVALWNGKDPILKERLFGLTNGEGNHGEDVKEHYYYLDSTPTHSYAKMLYKYPQAPFPYADLVAGSRARSRSDFEYELLDTGVFDQDRYWDVFVEYAKAGPEDILVRITACNRGPEAATLHVLPHIWFRNSWWADPSAPRPRLAALREGELGSVAAMGASHPTLGERCLHCESPSALLFTDNETNEQRLYGRPNASRYVKDGINDCVVGGRREAVNPALEGTKAAAHYLVEVAAGGRAEVRLRLNDRLPSPATKMFGRQFDEILSTRKQEADELYARITPASLSEDAARVVRQGMAGMLWSKQAYLYDVGGWLKQHGVVAGDGNGHQGVRNSQWFHMASSAVMSMPDKWEYPWFAAWDLAFHTIPLGLVDPDFAQDQLELTLRERYLHPNGQIPAYEWNFGDVNPPVHAWATLFNYRLNREALGEDALPFLKRMFHKLLLNFTWWVNRKDRDGRNLFEGGFLGLDNIGVFDRSAPLPTGGHLEQADGTAWMALFCQNMLDMALELAVHDPAYEELAIKFYEHFVWIASALDRAGAGQDEMWDEGDGFYSDVLRVPGQFATRLKVRSMVGLLPMCAATVYSPRVIERLPGFVERARWLGQSRPDLFGRIHPPGRAGVAGRRMLALLDERKLRRVLARLLDPREFLGDHGIRSLSRHHLENPYAFWAGNQEYKVSYLPAESDSGMFGGNSNWRGPIWMPVNALIIRALLQYYSYYGDDFRVECPVGTGQSLTLFEVARELANRLAAIFLRDHQGRRPVFGGTKKLQEDPHFRDHLLFYEYFHGDNGAGLGASHQTGWTGLVAALLPLFAQLQPERLLLPQPLWQPAGKPRVPAEHAPLEV